MLHNRDVINAQRVEIILCARPETYRWDFTRFATRNFLIPYPITEYSNVDKYVFVYTGSFTKECVSEMVKNILSEAGKHLRLTYFAITAPNVETMLYTMITDNTPGKWVYTCNTADPVEFDTFEDVSPKIIPTISILQKAFGISTL